MVAMVRKGFSVRQVARTFAVSQPTVQRWVDRAKGKRLDRVNFHDLSSAPKKTVNRTALEVESKIISLRSQLRDESPLGEFGAAAIRRHLQALGEGDIPSLRTIGYILERAGALDYRRRVRRPPPPLGWYLPDVAARLKEIDQFDYVGGLTIEGGSIVEVLNVISLHGGLCQSWPAGSYTTEMAMVAMLEHWRRWGKPAYAQFDNDRRFHGSHRHANLIGRVIKMCLGLGVVPVFAPIREHGLQNAIESYNGRWQEKVWGRFHYKSLSSLQKQSIRYVEASQDRSAVRREGAPDRVSVAKGWKFDEKKKVRGRIIYIRRSSNTGSVNVLGNQVSVDEKWSHRLVRCEVDIEGKAMRFYGLRRQAPEHQPLLREIVYQLPKQYVED